MNANPIEKRLSEQIGSLVIDNAKLATTIEMQNTKITQLNAEIDRLKSDLKKFRADLDALPIKNLQTEACDDAANNLNGAGK
jgi:outer membrane murein-binding lipoprotein Lpp